MKYHVIIKNNETGKVEMDNDASAIVGGVCIEGDEVASIGMIACSGKDMISTLQAARVAIDEILSAHPDIALLAKLLCIAKNLGKEESEREDV